MRLAYFKSNLDFFCLVNITISDEIAFFLKSAIYNSSCWTTVPENSLILTHFVLVNMSGRVDSLDSANTVKRKENFFATEIKVICQGHIFQEMAIVGAFLFQKHILLLKCPLVLLVAYVKHFVIVSQIKTFDKNISLLFS